MPLFLKFGIPLLIILAIGGLGMWGDRGWTNYKKSEAEIEAIVSVTRTASDNMKLERKDVKEQISSLGDSVRRLKFDINTQNKTIKQMAEEAIKNKAEAVELKKLADKAKAQRASAYLALEQMSLTPGNREDLESLCNDAEDALDRLYMAGVK